MAEPGKKRKILFNVLGALAFYIVFFWIGSSILNSYTKHGETMSVPDLRGLSFDKAKDILANKGFEFKIIDSSYNAKKLPLAILEQNPAANAKVKEGRTIYLTVNARSAPKIKMPDLIDVPLKQAQMILESNGLRVGKLIYKPDLAQNAVLDLLYKGQHIGAGADIKKGSVIDLVLGDGLGQTEIDVPDLLGRTLREAKFVLDASSLNLGNVYADNTVRGDTLNAYVYKQSPDFYSTENKVSLGGAVDVYVTMDKSLHDE